mmetsp:Transcript_61163/g.131528  ORF Transcript_61163/g.131528 Transcript_61163/m.131528 type:complete len:273 (+) Transcript_61163:725-1543(+)
MVGGNLGRRHEDAPLRPWNEELSLIVCLRSDNLRPSCKVADDLRKEILQGGLVPLLQITRHLHAGVCNEGIHKAVHEERDGVDSTKAHVERITRGQERTRILRCPLTRVHHAVLLHRNHQCIEITCLPRPQAELRADFVEELHEAAPLVLADIQVLVCVVHGPARISLRSSCEVAHDLNHEELEATTLRLLMPCAHGLVRIEQGICHPLIHTTVHEGGHSKDTAAASIETARRPVDPHHGLGLVLRGMARLHPYCLRGDLEAWSVRSSMLNC